MEDIKWRHPFIRYIIKAYATPALIRPMYVEAFDEKNLRDKVHYMKMSGDVHISAVEYVERDSRIEGAIKRCNFGSRNYDANLQYLYNLNADHPVDI